MKKQEYAALNALAVVGMARVMASLTSGDRRSRMRVIVSDKEDLFSTTFPGQISWLTAELSTTAAMASARERGHLLVDLAYTDPFTPHEVKWAETVRDRAFHQLAGMLGERLRAPTVWATMRDTMGVHHHLAHLSRKELAVLTGGSIAAVAGAHLLIPGLAPSIGHAAGLSGAAATAHGMAVLGGGSLASGGHGMAAGMHLLVLADVATVTGSRLIRPSVKDFAPAMIQTETMKLQTSLRALYPRDEAKWTAAGESLRKIEGSLTTQLHDARLREEPGGVRIEEINRAIRTVEIAQRWLGDPQMNGVGREVGKFAHKARTFVGTATDDAEQAVKTGVRQVKGAVDHLR